VQRAERRTFGAGLGSGAVEGAGVRQGAVVLERRDRGRRLVEIVQQGEARRHRLLDGDLAGPHRGEQRAGVEAARARPVRWSHGHRPP
jgi:hypothetical protein